MAATSLSAVSLWLFYAFFSIFNLLTGTLCKQWHRWASHCLPLRPKYSTIHSAFWILGMVSGTGVIGKALHVEPVTKWLLSWTTVPSWRAFSSLPSLEIWAFSGRQTSKTKASPTISPYKLAVNSSQLRNLNVANDSFIGQIPLNKSSCSHLQLLSLAGNNLTGKLCNNVACCVSFRYLIYTRTILLGKWSFLPWKVFFRKQWF